MADAGKVHANLMRAASTDTNFDQREFLEALQDLIVGDGGSAARKLRSHADAADGVARDGC